MEKEIYSQCSLDDYVRTLQKGKDFHGYSLLDSSYITKNSVIKAVNGKIVTNNPFPESLDAEGLSTLLLTLDNDLIFLSPEVTDLIRELMLNIKDQIQTLPNFVLHEVDYIFHPKYSEKSKRELLETQK